MFTAKQVAAVKYLIGKSKETERQLSKQIMFFLVDQSKNLSREVCVVLQEGIHGTREEISAIGHEISWLNSSNGTTHLNEIFTAMGCRVKFDVHYGNLEPNGNFNNLGQFPGHEDKDGVHPMDAPMRYTIWLAKPFYSPKARIVAVTREELEKINVKKSGLYEHIENQ